jgi:hypothetical protein
MFCGAERNLAGAGDSRLGKIDVMLVSYEHGDNAGNLHTKAQNAGACGKPDLSMVATPSSNSVNVTVVEKAKIVTGSDMQRFFAGKMKAAEGNSKDSTLVRFDGMQAVGSVGNTTVPAVQSNGLVFIA